MKTTKIKFLVGLILFLWGTFSYSQNYWYMGGNADGSSSESLIATTCNTPAHFYAYFGGTGDGEGIETLESTICATPAHFYAYFGGNGDGEGAETIENTICGFPPQFYAYFGSNGDGSSIGFTAPICPTQPPVANFTASATSICVGQSVTFTDTSTNIPSAWTWTLNGATPNTSTEQNPTMIYNTAGTYAVTLLVANYNGTDTKTITGLITVTAYPTVLTTTPASRCDSGTVILNATASAGTLNWYTNATGGTSLASGTAFTTPSIATTTTYFVETVNGVCSSARTAVTATVNTTPTITSTTPATRCGNGTVTLQAVASTGTIQWFANATGGTALATGASFTTPSLSATTSYFAQVSQNTCISPRIEVIATINTLPTVTSATPASRCDIGTVTLQAVASSGTLNWYANATGGTSLATGTSFTTPSIATTTTYYVEAVNGTCASARTAVIATVNTTPIIISTAPGSRCDAGTVTLSAVANAGTVIWYANATGGTALATTTSFTTPSISVTTTYYVEAVNGSCASGTRTAVIATINPSPTITSTTPATICGGDTFTISATATAGSLEWYNVPTGGIVQGSGNSFSLSNWAVTTTFYVQATNGSCQSARIPVIVTVNERPFNTTLSPATRCGTGSVTLGATYTIGTANWYNVASGGTSLATGPTFTTPIISTTTTYYVEAVNNGCLSAIRTAITATVNQQPTITSTTPASRCDSGTVTLSATASSGTINWYANATGGTSLATGGSFTTPSLNSSTTYYVEVSNGTCISTRTSVLAAVNTTPGIIAIGSNTRCNAGTLILSATADFGTISWFANATGGTALATGASFTTPILSVTTIYYAEVSSGGCSSARVAVTATIYATATPTGNSNQTFCTGETVDLIVANGTNIVWYDAATGGNVISNGTALVSGTIYYATQNANGCESSVRLPVTMTAGNCLGTESFDFNQIVVYPNPVSDVLKISSTQELSSIELIDLLGRTLHRKTNSNLETEIDMSTLPSATYLVKITVDKQIKTYKIIKK